MNINLKNPTDYGSIQPLPVKEMANHLVDVLSSFISSSSFPEIKIREWVCEASNPYRHPDVVPATQIG